MENKEYRERTATNIGIIVSRIFALQDEKIAAKLLFGTLVYMPHAGSPYDIDMHFKEVEEKREKEAENITDEGVRELVKARYKETIKLFPFRLLYEALKSSEQSARHKGWHFLNYLNGRRVPVSLELIDNIDADNLSGKLLKNAQEGKIKNKYLQELYAMAWTGAFQTSGWRVNDNLRELIQFLVSKNGNAKVLRRDLGTLLGMYEIWARVGDDYWIDYSLRNGMKELPVKIARGLIENNARISEDSFDRYVELRKE
ncbi:hypothetical protein HYW76_01675 [Candidatus Pacearchaeota archaeon]|nr:hypothetical protein [Candidatus Pacearchaeota archaeon]